MKILSQEDYEKVVTFLEGSYSEPDNGNEAVVSRSFKKGGSTLTLSRNLKFIQIAINGQMVGQIFINATNQYKYLNDLIIKGQPKMASIDDALLASPDVYEISKVTVIDRLEAAGKFDAVLAILQANTLQYERWQAVTTIKSDNAEVLAVLGAVGADVAIILAPEVV